ncbi:MAG: hypothetical protein ACJ735_13765 [Actinomycetes bacterium]
MTSAVVVLGVTPAAHAAPTDCSDPAGVKQCLPDLSQQLQKLHQAPVVVSSRLGIVIDINRLLRKSGVSVVGHAWHVGNVDGVRGATVDRSYVGSSASATASTTASSSATTPPPCYSSYYGGDFMAYQPFYASMDETAYWVEYEYAPFQENNARYLYGEGETWQVEICQMGGGHSLNGWRLNSVGTYTTDEDNAYRLISGSSGTYSGATRSTESRSLDFQLSGKVITISGSLSVDATHRQVGGQGDLTQVRPYDVAPQNAVYEYWDGHDSPQDSFQGSDGYEGNVSHALWEFPMSQYETYVDGAVFAGANCPGNFGCG